LPFALSTLAIPIEQKTRPDPVYFSFEVLKPMSVDSGIAAPAFNQIGLGTQFRSSKQLGDLLDQGFLKEVAK
jgi:hypothetical protein